MAERLRMVKYHGDRVSMEWDRPNGETREVVQLTCNDAPNASFVEAMEGLTTHALQLVEIQDKSWKAGAKVTKLHIKRRPDDRRAVIMTIHRPLEHGSATINTPLRMERLDDDEVGAGFITQELMKAVLAVQAEALAYALGQREQGELFAEEDGAEAAEEEEAEPVGAGA